MIPLMVKEGFNTPMEIFMKEISNSAKNKVKENIFMQKAIFIKENGKMMRETGSVR